MSTEDDSKYADYTNPYLDSVSFEIRFPSKLRVLNEIYIFQEKITEEYPNFVEEFPVGFDGVRIDANSVKRIVFSNLENNIRILVHSDKIAIISKDYTVFDDFYNRVCSTFDIFFSCYEIINFKRIGLRFIQNYEFVEDKLNDIWSKFNDYFVPFFNTEKIKSENLIFQNIHLVKQIPPIFEVTYGATFRKNSAEKYEYVLDFDLYTNTSDKISKYKEILNNLQEIKQVEFYNYVTDKFVEENMKKLGDAKNE